ncbi:MAG: sigma-70 family RNA polymerase sigma factor [Coleofasciculaceae cyanobacterium SM2_3_26]|nr:sigma-70 family RNA polymerase sigma factor [Coleofasciculaceae cyanobacterium SM2_3_26]
MASTSKFSERSPEHSGHYKGMELLVEYHQTHDVRLRNQLVRMNAGLVRKIAHRVSHCCAEPYEDLEQIGYIGLIRAIEKFNPGHGYAFSSFAVPYIRGEMLHFLRDNGGVVKVPRRWRELQRKGQKVQEQLTLELGHPPTDAEIAAELGVSLPEWRQSKSAAKNASPLSLDSIVGRQTDSPMTLKDNLIDRHQETRIGVEEERQQLHYAMEQLEEKTRQTMEFVFFQQLSRKQVARMIGVSPMTITRRIQKGIDELVAILQPQVVEQMANESAVQA